MKYCIRCKTTKNDDEFLKDKRKSVCLECNRSYTKEYRSSINGLIARIYSAHKEIARNQNVKVEYTSEQFFQWINKQDKFFDLYGLWIENGQQSDLKPCVIRKSSGNYSLDNLQIVDWKQSYLVKKIKQSKTVMQVDDNNVIMGIFPSTREAAKIIGVTRGAVAHSLKHNHKCKGYYFKYSNAKVTFEK